MGRAESGHPGLRFRTRSVPFVVLLVAAGAAMAETTAAEGTRPEALLQDLVGGDSAARSRARRQLMEFAGRDAPAVSRLFRSAEGVAAARLARIMAWTRDAGYVPALVEKAKASKDADSKGAYILAVGAIGEKSAVAALEGFARDDDPAVRLKAVEALRASRPTGASEKLLLEACKDPDEAVRSASHSAVAEVGSVETARFLIDQLQTRDEEAVLPAARAAGRLLARHRSKSRDDPDAFEPAWAAPDMKQLTAALIELVRRERGAMRAAAMGALREAGRSEAVGALVEILRDAREEAGEPEKDEEAALANAALQEITGRDLPPDVDAWGAVEKEMAVSSGEIEPEVWVEPVEGEGRPALPPERGPGSLAPAVDRPLWPYAVLAGAVVLVGLAAVIRARHARRTTAKLDARRKRLRERIF